jgi:hypothetical protein
MKCGRSFKRKPGLQSILDFLTDSGKGEIRKNWAKTALFWMKMIKLQGFSGVPSWLKYLSGDFRQGDFGPDFERFGAFRPAFEVGVIVLGSHSDSGVDLASGR